MKALNVSLAGGIMVILGCSQEPAPSVSKHSKSYYDDPEKPQANSEGLAVPPQMMQGGIITEMPILAEIGEIDKAPTEEVDPPSNVSGDRVNPQARFAFHCSPISSTTDANAIFMEIGCYFVHSALPEAVAGAHRVIDSAGALMLVAPVPGELRLQFVGKTRKDILKALNKLKVELEFTIDGELLSAEPVIVWNERTDVISLR